MDKTIRCHECGGDMTRDVRPDVVTYKGRAVEVDQPGWYCGSCKEVVFEGQDADVAEEAFVALKAEVDGILTPREVQRIRLKLGISQRRAGALLGGGPRSFQKYEAGTDWVTRSMANLLRLLDSDPGLLRVIGGDEGAPAPRRGRKPPSPEHSVA
ncbi:MAG: type II toxin-antitoxin system MqsA family antitoxin [Deltaproteobacteria bacterium]|nr:type II toxin-antitoxin system MqsA family antitoxin [Deltaproteobacteria bacterium]